MKKYYVIIAAALVVLAGCKKEEQKVSEIKDSSREVHFIVSDDVINKATLSTSSGFAWEAGDEDYFGIFTNYPRHAAATGLTIGGDKRADVAVSVDASATKGYLYYGNRDGIDSFDTIAYSWFFMDANQSQASAGVLDNMHNKVILTSQSLSLSGSETSVKTDFEMLTTYACFNIYSSVASDLTVSSVKFQAAAVAAGKYLAGKAHVKFPYDGTPELYEYANGNNTVKVVLGSSYSLSGKTDKASADGVFMGLMPANVTGYTITVETNAGDYVFTTANSIEFKAGKIKPINLDLEKATTKPSGGPVAWNDAKSFHIKAVSNSGTLESSTDISITANMPATGINPMFVYFDLNLAAASGIKVQAKSWSAGVSNIATGEFTNDAGLAIWIPDNDSATPRVHTVVFTGTDTENSNATRDYTLTINQAGVSKTPALTLSTEAIAIASDATTASFTVNTDYATWTATCDKTVTFSVASGGNVDAKNVSQAVTISDIPANESTVNTVVYTVTITPNVESGLSPKTVVITQAKKATITLPDYQDAENLWLPIDADAAAHSYDKAGQFGDVTFTAKTVSSSGIYSCGLTGGATGAGDGDGKFAIQPAAGSEITLASGNSFAFSATVRMSTGDTGAYSQIGLYGYNTSSSSWEVIAQCDKRAFNGTPYTYSITGTAAATYSNIQVVAFVRASAGNNVVEVKDIIFAKN